MNRSSYLLIVPIVCCMTNSVKGQRLSNSILSVAWNEDNVNSYVFALGKDGKFYYDITKKVGLEEKKEYYSGTVKYILDTLYLKYKGASPKNTTHFLVVEASGNYLIQYFSDSTKRMFLRVQRRILF